MRNSKNLLNSISTIAKAASLPNFTQMLSLNSTE